MFLQGSYLINLKMVKEIISNLKKDFSHLHVFSNVSGNPVGENVDEGVIEFKKMGCNGVIAVGGGSGLDVGKAIAFMSGQSRPIWDFEDIGDNWTRAITDQLPKVIAIPTTAGTGSETGRASLILDESDKTKKIIFHPKILPSTVICDPKLTLTMPQHITSGTGLDALAHCIEAYCSPNYHPMCQGMALEGMLLVKKNLPIVFNDGNNINGRAHMMSAAIMGATAFQKGLGLIHAFSHPTVLEQLEWCENEK